MDYQDSNNYFESVVIPVLQRKCQDLFTNAMLLETNFHVEVVKGRQLLEEISKIKSEKISVDNSVTALKQQLQNKDTEIVALRDQMQAKQEEINRTTNDLNTVRVKLNDTGNALNAAQHRITTFETHLENSKSELKLVQAELESTKLDLLETRKQLVELQQAKETKAIPAVKATKLKIADSKNDF